MNAINNNPYRTLGLFGNSKERDLQRQLSKLRAYTSTGKEVHLDYDFPFFGEVVRSTEKVQEAAGKIEQAKNKVLYALFWFLNNGHIDEAALDNLKVGNIEKAIEIWEKTFKDSTVTSKNFSAISNLSTLQLGAVTNNGSFDPEKFTASIELKGKLLTSDAFTNFILSVIGEGITINREIILKEFADEVIQLIKPNLLKPVVKSGLLEGKNDNGIGLFCWDNGDMYFGEWKDGTRIGFGIYQWGSGDYYRGHFNIDGLNGEGVYFYKNGTKNIGEWYQGQFQDNKYYDNETILKGINEKVKNLKELSGIQFNSISLVQFINSFRYFPDEIRQYVKRKFTDNPISLIESKIANCKDKREANPSDSAKYGEELYKETKLELTSLKNLLSVNDVDYQMIANKLSQEILQCSIDYFNEHHDSNSIDPGGRSLRLLHLAKNLNPTGQVKHRIEENEKPIQEWVNDKPERDKYKVVKVDLDFIGNQLEIFQSHPASISYTKEFITLCKPRLQKIKKEIGSADEMYLNISSAMVQNAQNMVVNHINSSLDRYNNSSSINEYKLKICLIADISEALTLTYQFAQFDMHTDLKSHYNKNLDALKSLAAKMDIETINPKESIEKKIKIAEIELDTILNRTYFKLNLNDAFEKLERIKKWKLFRSQETKDLQVENQNRFISNLVKQSEQEKEKNIKIQQDNISNLKMKLKEFIL